MEKDDIICPGQTIKEQSTLAVSPLYNFSCLPLPVFQTSGEELAFLAELLNGFLFLWDTLINILFYFYFSFFRKNKQENHPQTVQNYTMKLILLLA